MYVHIFYPHKTFQSPFRCAHAVVKPTIFFFFLILFFFWFHDSVRLTESTVTRSADQEISPVRSLSSSAQSVLKPNTSRQCLCSQTFKGKYIYFSPRDPVLRVVFWEAMKSAWRESLVCKILEGIKYFWWWGRKKKKNKIHGRNTTALIY